MFVIISVKGILSGFVSPYTRKASMRDKWKPTEGDVTCRLFFLLLSLIYHLHIAYVTDFVLLTASSKSANAGLCSSTTILLDFALIHN